MPIMQLNSCCDVEDLLRQRVIPALALQDLQSLAACCRGLRAFAEALPEASWRLVAR